MESQETSIQTLKQRIRNEDQRTHTAQAINDRRAVIDQISKYLSSYYTLSWLKEFLVKAGRWEPLPIDPK